MIADKQIKLIIGSLLHDIGKVVYRSGDGRNHSESGYQYLRTETHISDEEILECVRYHHGMYLRKADIPKDSNAYLTYYADNVSAFADRREKAIVNRRQHQHFVSLLGKSLDYSRDGWNNTRSILNPFRREIPIMIPAKPFHNSIIIAS